MYLKLFYLYGQIFNRKILVKECVKKHGLT
nr:MAG TPA: hypothetical protein [Caudoviricetes sp.]